MDTISSMKIAILSDVHGNLLALQAVKADIEGWRPDLVVVAGDVVNGGPNSKACTQIVKRQQKSYNWQVLRGNHEDYVIEWAEAGPGDLLTLVELRSSRDAQNRWSQLYRERVLVGEISTKKAVKEFLSAPEFMAYLDV